MLRLIFTRLQTKDENRSLCKLRNTADKISFLFFFSACLCFSVFQMFCNEHIFLFLVKIKKQQMLIFKKKLCQAGAAPARSAHPVAPSRPKGFSCPPEAGTSLRGSFPLLPQREVSGCGFPVRELEKQKAMSLKYHEGRPGQMLS